MAAAEMKRLMAEVSTRTDRGDQHVMIIAHP
jgi:hypothetical protein